MAVEARLSIEEIMKRLSPDSQRLVREFAWLLLDSQQRRKQDHPRLDWAGGLKELRDEYTSLELQKKSLEWRDE